MKWRIVTSDMMILLPVLLCVDVSGCGSDGRLGSSPPPMSNDADSIGDDHFVVLDPEKWINKRLPIADFVEPDSGLASGTWIVVLYHHGCPDCEKVMSSIGDSVRMMSIDLKKLPIVFVEVPPYNEPQSETCDGLPMKWGRLSDKRDWFAPTPTVLYVKDSQVLNIWINNIPDPELILSLVCD